MQFTILAFALLFIVTVLTYAAIQRSRRSGLVEIRRVTAAACGITYTYSEGAFPASHHLGSRWFLPGDPDEVGWRTEMSELPEEHPGSHTSMDRVEFTVESRYVTEEEAARLLGQKGSLSVPTREKKTGESRVADEDT